MDDVIVVNETEDVIIISGEQGPPGPVGPITDHVTVDYIDFTTNDVTPAVGRIYFDPIEGGLEVGMNGGNVRLSVGQETIQRVVNKTGGALVDGQVVYISGAQSDRLTVGLASASSEATSHRTLGIVTEPIANNGIGYVTTQGLVRGLNTNAYAEGTMLWLSNTAGQLTSTRPSAPNHSTFVGFVVRSHPSNGSIYVHVQNGYELDELHNVLITSPVAGNTLTYDGSLWRNRSALRLVSVPSSATATGSVNDIAFDSTHLYVCVATNTWRRTQLSTW
jgi:hypothetical protein